MAFKLRTWDKTTEYIEEWKNGRMEEWVGALPPILPSFHSSILRSSMIADHGFFKCLAFGLLEPNSQSGSGNPLPGYQVIERAIPILCKAVKDRSADTSDKDVTDYLESLARQLPAANRDGLRCQIRLLLARSLVTRDPSVYENTLKQIAQICEVNPDLVDDTEVLLDAVARNMADTDLRNLVDTARNYLTLLKQKPGSQPTQKS
jgi:hypothetical protein